MEQYHLSAILDGQPLKQGGSQSKDRARGKDGAYETDTMFVPTMDSIGGHDLAEFDSSSSRPITVIGGATRRISSSHASQSITSSSGEFSASTVHKSLIDLFDGLRSRRVEKSHNTREQVGQPALKRKVVAAPAEPDLNILNILAQEKTDSSDSETDTDYDSYSE